MTDVGRVLDGKYLLQSQIGGGRFGSVYRALHVALQKPVAVKLLRPHAIHTQDFEQFRIEAEALGRLSHPHIVGVADFGVDFEREGTPYLVMDLVEGETLHDMLQREGCLDLTQAAPLLAQVAAALDHAHRCGVIHGDLTARNIIIQWVGSRPLAKVIDFGLAQLSEHPDAAPDREEVNVREEMFGARVTYTPEYAAPERARGARPSSRSDVYAFAVLSYRTISGRFPFEGATDDVLHAHLTQVAAPLSQVTADVPAHVDRVFVQGLAKEAQARQKRPGEIAHKLAEAARQLIRARWRRAQAPRRVLAAVVISAGLVAAGVALSPLGPFHRLEGATLDLRVAAMPPRPPSERLLLVSIDDDSLADDARPLSLRGDEFAATLELALAHGASVVALDLLLPETWATSPRWGELLLTRSDALVLAMTADDSSVVGTEVLDPLVVGVLGPEASGELFGLVTVSAGDDGIVRHARARLIDQSGRERFTFAARAAEVAGVDTRRSVPVEGFFIDYSIDAARFERLGWAELEDALNAGRQLIGKVVLIGAEFTGSGDRHRIPGPGRLTAEVSGLTLQAVIVDGLLQRRWLRQISGTGAWVLVGLLLLVSILPLLWLPNAATAVGVATVMVVLFLSTSVVMFRIGAVVPVAVPVVAWMSGVGIGLLLRRAMSRIPE